MNIPEEAYEAATRAEFNHWGATWPTLTYETDVDHREYLRLQIERAVEASAPIVAAKSLRDAASALERCADRADDGGAGVTGNAFALAADILTERADRLDAERVGAGD